MPKLKCIGGLADGELALVHNNFRENDIVQVNAKIEFKIADFNLQDAYVAASSAVPFYYYKICKLQYNEGKNTVLKLHYLIPEKWEIAQAIQHLFACHRPYDG